MGAGTVGTHATPPASLLGSDRFYSPLADVSSSAWPSAAAAATATLASEAAARRRAAVPAQLTKVTNLLAMIVHSTYRMAVKFEGGSRRLGREHQRSPSAIGASSSSIYVVDHTAGTSSSRTPRRTGKAAEAISLGSESVAERLVPAPVKRP